MKTTMKKTAAYLLALLLVFQLIPAIAENGTQVISGTQGPIVDFRERLQINAVTSTLTVDMTVELSVSDQYDNIEWKSDNEDIATVDENGVVTGVAAGQVKITATAGEHSDSITLRVVGTDSDKGNVKQGEKMIIIINGDKEKKTYNGETQTLGYSATSPSSEFDKNKLQLNNPEHLASGKDCGTWQDQLTKDDFSYDGEETVEYVITNGWLQIKPVTATIIVADQEMVEGGEEPELTATVTGLAPGDDASVISYTLEISGEKIVANFDEVQGNYKVKSVDGDLIIKQMNNYPLYHLVDVKGTWYRLGKTTIATEKTLDEYVKGLKTGNVKVVSAAEYQADLYSFEDLEIEVDKKKYVYKCEKNAEAIVLGANYYTASLKNVEAVKQKIGGMNGNNPRWLVPEEDRYNDPNATDSLHMNYTITLYENKAEAVQQTVYNMLSVNGSTDYYKMRTTSITAQPMESMKEGKQPAGEYILEKYDFRNVVLKIDGVEYKYNDGSLDQYENYFTVEFENVDKNKQFNRNATWFKNPDSWLDGAREEYGDLPNDTLTLHANYKATTHDAEERPRSVIIHSDWPEDRTAYPGAKITLTATTFGFGDNVRFQWQRSAGNDVWEDIPGANEITYTYILNDSTAQYIWRVVAEDQE